jgi:hypothetical protein
LVDFLAATIFLVVFFAAAFFLVVFLLVFLAATFFLVAFLATFLAGFFFTAAFRATFLPVVFLDVFFRAVFFALAAMMRLLLHKKIGAHLYYKGPADAINGHWAVIELPLATPQPLRFGTVGATPTL